MNWKLILGLSTSGLAIALPPLFGFTPVFLWPIVSVVCVCLIISRAPGRLALHAFAVGPNIQIVNGLISAYYLHDTATAGIIELSRYGIHPQIMNLLSSLLAAAATGALFAAIVW